VAGHLARPQELAPVPSTHRKRVVQRLAFRFDGVSTSEVSRICGELDRLVEAFRTRALTTEYPYLGRRDVS
jgi:transposase-like protein